MANIKVKRLAKRSSITLGAEYDITQAKAMAKELQTVLKRGVPIAMNARQVEHIDTAILQLLLMFRHAADAKQVTFEWQKPSEPLLRLAKMLDLTEEMGLK